MTTPLRVLLIAGSEADKELLEPGLYTGKKAEAVPAGV